MSTGPSSSRGRDAVRLLLTPKWVVLSVLVVVLSIAFAAASSWQYQRAMDQVNARRAAATEPAPIAQLVPAGQEVPSASLGRVAQVAGRYAADAWVAGRTSADGEPGYWLVTAVDDGSGLLTAVLRGWLPARTDSAATGLGEAVSVTGRVSSPENFYTDAPPGPDGQLVAVTDEALVQLWGGPLRPGYLVLTEQDPPLRPTDPQPVPAAFGTAPSVGFPWQNAGYAVQWITFIGFVGFMYWRFFRDDLQSRREDAPASDTPALPGSAPDVR